MCAADSYPASWIARSMSCSVSESRPYPDLTSTVVAPCSSMPARCLLRSVTRSGCEASRVARTVERMPPPPAWISS